MKNLKNKRGGAVVLGLLVGEFIAVMALALATSSGAINESKGKWGENGYDNFEARQAKIEANGGHINNKSRWWEDIKI